MASDSFIDNSFLCGVTHDLAVELSPFRAPQAVAIGLIFQTPCFKADDLRGLPHRYGGRGEDERTSHGRDNHDPGSASPCCAFAYRRSPWTCNVDTCLRLHPESSTM
jgi:hypothetical protein